MPRLREVGPDFIGDAPRRWVFERVVHAPAERVFSAISADPATWKGWFPGFGKGGYVGTPGLGCGRWVTVGGTRYDETMIEWDEPTRWTYRVDRTTVPMAKALVERWDVEPHRDATLVRWTFATEPGLFFSIAGPLIPRVMGGMFQRAMRNLETLLGSGLSG